MTYTKVLSHSKNLLFFPYAHNYFFTFIIWGFFSLLLERLRQMYFITRISHRLSLAVGKKKCIHLQPTQPNHFSREETDRFVVSLDLTIRFFFNCRPWSTIRLSLKYPLSPRPSLPPRPALPFPAMPCPAPSPDHHDGCPSRQCLSVYLGSSSS